MELLKLALKWFIWASTHECAVGLAVSFKVAVAVLALKLAHGRFWKGALIYICLHLALLMLIDGISRLWKLLRPAGGEKRLMILIAWRAL